MPIVSRIHFFVCSVLFPGGVWYLVRGIRTDENEFKSSNYFVFLSGCRWSFPRLFREQSARLARVVLVRFFIAILSLDVVESHRNRQSSRSSYGRNCQRQCALLPPDNGRRCWLSENRMCHADPLWAASAVAVKPASELCTVGCCVV